MEKRGQAGIITVIIIIILVLAAFIIVYNVYYYLLKTKLGDITLDTFMVDGELEYYLPGNFAIISVHRKADTVNISGIKILFNEKDTGATYSFNTSKYPEPLQTKQYVIFRNQLVPEPSDPPLPAPAWTFSKIGSIALHYILIDNKVSKELDKKEVTENVSEGFDKSWYCDKDQDGFGVIGGTVYDSKTAAEAVGACGLGKSSPAGGDCDDNLGTGANINPSKPEVCDGVDNNCVNGIDENNAGCYGSTPYCSAGVCAANKNYGSTSYGTHSLWAGSSDCLGNWLQLTIPSTTAVQLILGTNYPFYNGVFNTLYVCRNGYVSMSTTSTCLEPSTAISSINGISANQKMVALSSIDTFYYCEKSNELLLKWIQGSITSKVIIKSNNEIVLTYGGGNPSGRAGISNASTTYSEQKNGNGNTNYNDFQFIF